MIIRKDKQVEADVVRLIVNTREKFPHTPPWDSALKRVIWRYAGHEQPEQVAARRKRRRRSHS